MTDMFKYHNDENFRLKTLSWNQKWRNNNKLRLKKYEKSDNRKKSKEVYLSSKSGIIYRKKHNALRSPMNHLKQRNNLVMENCAICNSSNTQFHHPNNKLPLHVYFLCKKHHKEQHTGGK